jgi:hypothetical protein
LTALTHRVVTRFFLPERSKPRSSPQGNFADGTYEADGPMKPMSGGEKWWPDESGQPSSSGSQNSMRYAFFPKVRRLLIEKQGNLTTYERRPSD